MTDGGRYIVAMLDLTQTRILSRPGELAVRRWENPKQHLFYDGYSTYGKVEAELDPEEQRKATTMLKVGDLKHFCVSIDGFKEVYSKAKEGETARAPGCQHYCTPCCSLLLAAPQ